MKTADFFALAEAHYDGDEARFKSALLQASYSVRDEPTRTSLQKLADRLVAVPLEAKGTVVEAPPADVDLVLTPATFDAMSGLERELRHRFALLTRGIPPRTRLLFSGPPGNGKTTAAAQLARSLGLSAYCASLPRLVESYMGQTGQNLDKLFAVLRAGHLLIVDEMDAIGSSRTAQHSGAEAESNRVVATLLTLMDRTREGVLVATTNRRDLLDPAVLRRFDAEVSFPAPGVSEAHALVDALRTKYGLCAATAYPAGDSFDALTKAVLVEARLTALAEIEKDEERAKKSHAKEVA
jgi:SpoVK/Ycf46/Vps4 family AAA+-type ATPase